MNRIQEIREERQCSIQEAKAIERKERLTKAINYAGSVDDLKPILLEIVSLLRE